MLGCTEIVVKQSRFYQDVYADLESWLHQIGERED